MSTQQPYPSEVQKQTYPDRLPIYTRRSFATLVHVFCILGNIVGLYWLFLQILSFGFNPEDLWSTFYPVPYWPVMAISFLANGVTSILAIATPKFLHRKQTAVLVSLLPANIARVLAVGLTYYYSRLVYLLAILILDTFIFFGMLQGSKDNFLASIFVPFRKQ